MTILERYCVFRKSVKAKAFKKVPAGITDVPGACKLLIDRFLVKHEQGWDRPNPLAQEIILHRLQPSPQSRRGYHSLAADYYVRYFHARQLQNTGDLGGHFVEARYHLTR